VAARPPLEPGQRSPDGMWWWDGRQWVPVMSPNMRPRGSRAWIGWLAAGCVVIVVVGVVAIGFGIKSLVNTYQQGGFACLPSDFPSYPGAAVTSENTYFGTGVAPGDTKRCRMVLEAADDVTKVTTFYEQKLDSGDWATDSSDHSTGEIVFHLKARPATSGTIDLLGRGTQTEIRIQIDS
jgi:hypothetical protein